MVSYLEKNVDFLSSAPKVELHIHFDGAFDNRLLWDAVKSFLEEIPAECDAPWSGSSLLVRESIKLSIDSGFDKFLDLMQVQSMEGQFNQIERTGNASNGLMRMLDCFGYFLPIVQGRKDLIKRLAFEFCKNQMQQNIIYTEMRYAPHILMSSESWSDLQSPEAVIEAISDGIESFMKFTFDDDSHGLGPITMPKTRIYVNQILCCLAYAPHWSYKVYELAVKYQHRGVVGIDIAAGESFFQDHWKYKEASLDHRLPPVATSPSSSHCREDMTETASNITESLSRSPQPGHQSDLINPKEEDNDDDYKLGCPHRRALLLAKRAGMGVTVHAGEESGPDSVIAAVLDYGATRIGHGYSAHTSEEAIALLLGRGIHLECCPTSSVATEAFILNPCPQPTPSPSLTVEDDDHSGGERLGEGETVVNVDTKFSWNWSAHPIRALIEAGVSVSINSDDPSVLGVTLTDELRLVHNALGINLLEPHPSLVSLPSEGYSSLPLLGKLTIDAMKSAFTSSTIQEDCLKRIEEFYLRNKY